MWTYSRLKEDYDMALYKLERVKDELLDKLDSKYIYEDNIFYLNDYNLDDYTITLTCDTEYINDIIVHIDDLDELERL